MTDPDLAALAEQVKQGDAYSSLEKARELAELASRHFQRATEEAEKFTMDRSRPEHFDAAVMAAEMATAYGDQISEIVAPLLEAQEAVREQLRGLAAQNAEVEAYLREMKRLEDHYKEMLAANASAKTSAAKAREVFQKLFGRRRE